MHKYFIDLTYVYKEAKSFSVAVDDFSVTSKMKFCFTKCDSKQIIATFVFLNMNWLKVNLKVIVIFLKDQDAVIEFSTIYFAFIIKTSKIVTACLESV